MKKTNSGGTCDYCAYNEYDEDEEEWFCSADMDEDDMYHYLTDRSAGCPFFRNGDEYAVVRHQI